MRKEFEMSEEELQAIYDISRNQMPVIFVGTWLGLDSKQEKANNLWQQMAKKYGFLWNTAGPSRISKDPKCFSAVIVEKEGKTPTEIASEQGITVTGDDTFNALEKEVKEGRAMSIGEAMANMLKKGEEITPSETIEPAILEWNRKPMDELAAYLSKKYEFQSTDEALAIQKLVDFYYDHKK